MGRWRGLSDDNEIFDKLSPLRLSGDKFKSSINLSINSIIASDFFTIFLFTSTQFNAVERTEGKFTSIQDFLRSSSARGA